LVGRRDEQSLLLNGEPAMASEVVPGELPNERRSAMPLVANPVNDACHAVSMPSHGWSVQPKMAMALFAFCGALVLAGCSSGSPNAASPTTTTTTASPITKPNGPAEMALAAYRAMWADMVIASRTSDYKSPLLPQHASGAALSVLVQGLAKNQAQGIVAKGKPTMHPEVTSLSPSNDPTQATISDCFNDAGWLEYRTSGGLANNIPGGNRATEAVVDADGNDWKVTQLVVQRTGTC
jgi:hypothetical protein